ncbi:MAG: TVP38/TMEM64 family protein [Tissierellia bacterium]|nr:TVP38/TMEM64 family protein [Tissierellia bacterium]
MITSEEYSININNHISKVKSNDSKKEYNNRLDSDKFINLMTILGFLITGIFAYWAYREGLFTDSKALDRFLINIGIWGPIIFIFLQIVQTVVPIIPGALTCVAGVMIFGYTKGFIYNYIGIIIGSVIDYFIAKKFGRPLVRTLIGKRKFEKYENFMLKNDRFKKAFLWGMIIPISPGDALCLLAGLHEMSFKKFFKILIITKPFTIISYTLMLNYFINLGINFIK